MEVKIFKQVEDLQEAEEVISKVEEIEKAHSGNYALEVSVYPKSERFGSGFISKDSACHALRGREGREIFLPANRRLQETDGQPDS